MSAAFETSTDAVLVLDDDGRCIDANRAACSLFGVDPEQLIDRRVEEFAPSVAAKRGEGSAFVRGAGSGAQVEVRRGDGSQFLVSFTVAADVVPGCHLLTLRDITARVGADQLLARQQRELLEAQVVGGFGHWDWDLVADRTEWSDGVHRIWGLEPGTVTTVRQSDEHIHPDDLAMVRAAVEDARAGADRFEHRFRIVRGDGEVRLIEARGAVARATDGTALRMFGTAQDITDRLEVETERRNFSTILDGSDDAITALSADGTFASWNRGAEKLYGYSAEEAVGQTVELLFPSGERDAHERPWKRILCGEHVEPFEGTRIAKNGREVVVDTTLSAIKDARGEVVGVAAISRDITAHRQSQVALAEAHAKAVAVSHLKSQFMANMNHELRTPLNGVIGVSALLRDTPLDDIQREYLEALRVSGDALMAVIEDMLDFSKIEAGKLELATEPFALRAVIEDVCSLVTVGQPNSAVEVIACLDSSVPDNVCGDATRVRQVLTNLANNAVKFTEEGEVAIHVSGMADETGVVALQFEVVDTGIGIEPVAQAAIFDSFAQADGSTTRRYGGTGLGLTIAKELVTLMGGEIGVHSEVGEGSTFWFTVPLPVAPSQAPRPADPALERIRILVVDDKATNQHSLKRQLDSWGMSVDTFADGDSALAALCAAAGSERPYEFALVDFEMPGVSGDELVDAIRADAALRAMKVVLMAPSRHAHSATTVSGLDGLVTKPIRDNLLHDELARVIGARPGSPSLEITSEAGLHPPEITGCRVLVAEDNPVNQLVAVRLLQRRGLGVDVAHNGREAIEMHERAPYDAIFMDCQMPELDGYDATREIRRLEGATRHTPIIAMTASTMPGDTERCLAAGMDYYSGKPINPAGLDYVLGLALGTLAANGSS